MTKRLAPSTKSIETLSLAQKWITDCIANHPLCSNVDKDFRWYPTRLLDCGSLGSSDGSYRLIETGNADLDGPYMTLSHCWGFTDCLKLTTDNYA
jgi:hypothetical protein